jgi:hypothetical protein
MAQQLLKHMPAGTILRVYQLWSDDNQAGRELLGGFSILALLDGWSDGCGDITWIPDPANPDEVESEPSLWRIDDNDEFEVVPEADVEDWVWVELAKKRLLG